MSCKCLAEHVVAHSFSNSILFLKKIYLERDLSMTTIKKNPTIKPLPRGLGTMTLTKNGTIEYKKIILYPDGSKKRKTVHGTSQKECLNKMNDFEKNLSKQPQVLPQSKITLIDALYHWFEEKKKPILKEQAYRRELGTIKNQIGASNIAHYRYQSITSAEIQSLLNSLNANGYSYSVIKKTYDTFNSFYRDMSKKEHFQNPMDFVSLWRKSNVITEEKEVHFWGYNDIQKFVQYAGERYKTGALRYPAGYALAANIYLGLRIGELLALTWKDIDFTHNLIYVCKTLIEVENPAYDSYAPEEMKKQGIKKVIFKVQSSTKRDKNRYVPINENARELLLKHYEYAVYTDPDDFVITTRNRKSSTTKNISDTIKSIVMRADLSVKQWNTHILRHTCASLYFRAGVDIFTISKILGNSVEVLQQTYLHLIEEQLQTAAQKQAALLPHF